MLAKPYSSPAKFGSLGKDIHLPATSLHGLLNFIAGELPNWRDRPDRAKEASETSLSSQLCDHLNSAVRRSPGWDIFQFRTEVPDDRVRGRTIDLAPKPAANRLWVDGRSYIDFDILLPIECKRLPTPEGRKRDEREYVFSQYSSTGGIQRFKAGHHGAAHNLGAMIAYIQEETPRYWNAQISKWINDLVVISQKGWTVNDLLQLEQDDATRDVAILRSSHTRDSGLPDIMLRHLWVQMN